MLWTLFEIAVVIVAIAMVPAAILAIWFLLPWLCLLIGALACAIWLYDGCPNNGWLEGFGLGGGGIGLLLLYLQGYNLD
ncbi:MAG TPA: hypothetical protein VMV15_05575 [Candidatus Binataceae bacterium]|nr:hypothetical protein [Candidatus Binataceae bacterium]